MVSLNNQDNGSGFQSASASRSIVERITGASPRSLTDHFLPDYSAALWQRSVKAIKSLSIFFLVLALILSTAAMVGWIFNIDPLKHMLYNQLTGFPSGFWLAFVTLAHRLRPCSILKPMALLKQ